MATELATAYISLVPSARGLKSSIEKDLSGAGRNAANSTERSFKKSAGRVGSSFKSAFKGLAIGAAAGIGAAAVGIKSVVEAASNLDEARSKINAVFGPEVQADIDAFAEKAAGALGQSKQQVNDAVGSFGNLLTSFGVIPNKAADMSKSFTTLASDLASFNNTSVDDALAALTSGLSGETEPLKKYGVALDDASLKAKALEMGLVESTVDRGKLAVATTAVEKAERKATEAKAKFGAESLEARDATAKQQAATEKLGELMQGKVPATLSPAQKAQAAYALVMERTTNAQGDFARTSGGLANKQRILGAKFANLKTTIGSALLPVILKLATAFEDHVMPVITEVAGGIRAFIAAFRDGGDEVTSSGLAGKLESFGVIARNAFDGVAVWWKENGPQIKKTATEVFQRIGEIVTTVVGLVRQHWPEIQTIITNVITTVKSVITGAVEFVTTIWRNFGDNILNYVQDAWGPIQSIIKGALDVIQGIINTVMGVLTGDWSRAWDGIKAVVSGALALMQGIISLAWEAIKAAAGVAWEVIKSAVSSAWESITTAIKDKWDAAVTWVGNGIIKLVGWFTSLPSQITSAVSGMWDGIVAGFKAAINTIIQIWNDLEIGFDGYDIPGPGPNIPSFTIGTPDLPLLKYHTGGVIAGPVGSEVPIMGLAGERVLSPSETADYESGRGRGPMIGSATFVGVNERHLVRQLEMFDRRQARSVAVL